MHVSLCTSVQVSEGARSIRSPGPCFTGSCVMWVLGNEPGSSGRTTSALNFWARSLFLRSFVHVYVCILGNFYNKFPCDFLKCLFVNYPIHPSLRPPIPLSIYPSLFHYCPLWTSSYELRVVETSHIRPL